MDSFSTVVDSLTAMGNLEVYDMAYEQIVRKLRIEEALCRSITFYRTLITMKADDWTAGDPITFLEDAIPGSEKVFPKIC